MHSRLDGSTISPMENENSISRIGTYLLSTVVPRKPQSDDNICKVIVNGLTRADPRSTLLLCLYNHKGKSSHYSLARSDYDG